MMGGVHMDRQGLIERIQRLKKQPKRKELMFASAEKANFKEIIPGASRALLWGSDDTGPYGAFTKFTPGFDAGMHLHTSDARVVVIKGAYVYRDETGEKRVGPGDFIFIPGGKKHWSGGDSIEGALFFEEMDGKFDLIHVV